MAKYMDTLAAMKIAGQIVVTLGSGQDPKLDSGKEEMNYYIKHGIAGGFPGDAEETADDMAARSESDHKYDVMMIICSAFDTSKGASLIG